MKIIVCVKQVPDTNAAVSFNADGTLNRAAMSSIMNPDDKAGLEAALRQKDEYGAEVTVITMGLPKAADVLREAVAMGADRGILLTDRALGGSDTWATSCALAGAIRNLEYDLVITGRQAIDGDTAQVGPEISEHLDIPLVSYCEELRIEDGYAVCRRAFDDRYHVLKVKMPCVITVLSEMNSPRYMTPGGIYKSCETEFTIWSRNDLKGVEDSNIGLSGSPTKIARSCDKPKKGKGEVIACDPDDGARYIFEKLLEKHVI